MITKLFIALVGIVFGFGGVALHQHSSHATRPADVIPSLQPTMPAATCDPSPAPKPGTFASLPPCHHGFHG